METIIIQLSEEEVALWRAEGPAAAKTRAALKRLGRMLRRTTKREVEIATYPEYNPDYFDPRSTTLWRAE